jgi:hypothetical protein
MAKECQSEDSIITFVGQNPNELKVLSNSIMRFYFSGDKETALRLLKTADKSKSIKSNPFFLNNHYSDWGYYYLWEGKLDSTAYYLNLWDGIPNQDPYNYLTILQLKGTYFYFKNRIDSAKYYFSEGYRLSKQEKNEPLQARFANNLGAIAFQASMYGTSSYYFSDAYRINSKNQLDNKMLTNNLAACYLNENDPKKAIELLRKLEDALVLGNNSYEGTLTKINYISALLSLNKIKDAKKIIENMFSEKIPEALQGELFILRLRYLQKNDFEDAQSFVLREAEKFKEFNSLILQKFGTGIIELYSRYPKIYQYLDLKIGPERLNEFNSKTKHHYHKIRSLEYERKGLTQKALSELRYANESLREYNSITDSLKIADTRANIALVELEDQLNQSTKELNYSKRLNKQNRVSIILLALLIIILIGFGYFIYQNRTNKIRLAQLEIDSKSLEASFLEEEKRLNSRITSLSKIIIDKSKELAQKIKEGPYSNEPEIYNVQKELEQLSLINATVNTTSDLDILNQDHGFLKNAGFAKLNDTKKRVLILSVEQYKPKEIAATLGLSYAYVRNVQVELRKLIQQNGFSSFQELKLL